MKLRSIVRWVASTAGGTVLTPFLQAPATKLAETLHFDTTLSDRWGPLVQWFSDLTNNPWYFGFAGLVVGFALGMWVDAWLRDRERAKSKNEPKYTETRLKLRLDPAGSGNYIQEAEKNVEGWQQTVMAITVDQMHRCDTISMVFKSPTPYERPVVDTFGHSLEGIGLYSLGPKGYVLVLYGSNQPGMIELWFPPLGHYAAKSVASQFKPSPQAR